MIRHRTNSGIPLAIPAQHNFIYMIKEIANPGTTIFKTIQALTDQAKRLAIQHDFTELRNCMKLVQQMYNKGNATVKNAVENVFVFAFSSILPRCNQMEWRMVQSCMPPELYTIYVRQ